MKGLHKNSGRKVENPMKWMEDDAFHAAVKDELQKFISSNDYIKVPKKYMSAILLIARHFAEWGKRQAGKEEALYEMEKEQKPAELSEDESITAEIVDFIQRNAERGDDIMKSAGWVAYLERQKEYIEDIRQYAYNKGLVEDADFIRHLRPQPKHENMIELFYPSPGTAIHDAIEEAVEKVNTSGEKVVLEFNDWHRIIEPGDNEQTLEEEFFARYRKWKPSDEQIRPLEYAIDFFKKKKNDTTYLESLLNDLKKL